MKFNNIKKITSLILALVMVGVIVPTGINVSVDATTPIVETPERAVNSISVWSGSAATEYAGGSGTQDDPYIIETADQLYLALSSVTDTTQNVAGGKQTSEIKHQDYDKTTSSGYQKMVPVYTPYYYKVADGVKAFYLNDIRGSETLAGIKSFVAGSSKNTWNPGTSFVGNLDGNGVTIYGMYSSNGKGFVAKMDGTATVQNFNFDSCYSKSTGCAAIVTTVLGSYTNDSTIETIANVSVRNCYIQSTRNIVLGSNNTYSAGAAGVVSTSSTAQELKILNTLFDGYSCEIVQGSSSEVTTPEGYVSTLGGIISGSQSMNNVTLSGCVSLGAPVVDEVYIPGKEINYNRYTNSFQVYVYNNYTDYPTTLCDAYPGKYDKLLSIHRLEVKNKYVLTDMPELKWRSDWQLVELGSRAIPMPKNNSKISTSFSSYTDQIIAQNGGTGAVSIIASANPSGTYGMYHDLIGSGTKEDPYFIDNAFHLARAIASGGKNAYNRVYYKLTCDIDASESTWITQDTPSSSKYTYVNFNGEIDGDGHVVTGVFCGDDDAAGLIPVLGEEGVVKNLHVRDSSFVSGGNKAGAIAGESLQGSLIEGCSVENCQVYGVGETNNAIAGGNAVIKNSYCITDDKNTTKYYKADGTNGDIDVEANSDVWYIGGASNSIPRLKNFGDAREYFDIDGDGQADSYGASDLVALRKKLLMSPGYENVYADVSRNGVVNIVDLAVLTRMMVGDYDKISDGFWRNLELGTVKIYYGENDNYDAARLLEIYLEVKFPKLDIQKVVSANKTVSGKESDKNAVYVHENDIVATPTGSCEIIVGDIANYSAYSSNSLETNDYSIEYNKEKCVVWLKGGSFTGVEQAVRDFITNSNEKTGYVYSVEKATLDKEKWAKTVLVDTDYDGVADTEKVMYYAWGDEFEGVIDGDKNPEISTDIWYHSRMNTETNRGTAGTYRNVEGANASELSKLYQIKDGTIYITRGVKAEYATAETDFLGYERLYNQTGKDAFGGEIDDEDIIANPGYVKSNASLLWKQGYAEMYGSLPSDGHTFASWWMLGHGVMTNYAMDESLYGKVYKLNDTGKYAYDGKTVWPISNDLTTYKYQVPTNYFEIDIWELMQSNGLLYSSYQKTSTTGSYDYRLYLNVHKFYSVGARSQATVNVIDWDNPDTPRGVMQKEWFGEPSDDYYFSASAAYYDFTSGSVTRYTKDRSGRVTAKYNEDLQIQLTAPRRYGFYWSTNGVDKFNFTLYIYDVNGDGIEGDDAIVGSSSINYNTQDGMKPSNYDIVNDAEVANQYMYFIIDNVLYTSNAKHNDATEEVAVMFTDMLTNEGTTANPDKIGLEMDYLRVYQYDGRRDIITRETENFNNGNHFGY
ncbi:MAG: hypothetical protein IKT42_06145 [Clostridia bacterium]|nr:hypothetical protein [Clostridia bacterium]